MTAKKSKRPATKQGERRVRLLAPYTIDGSAILVGSVVDLPEEEAHRLEQARRAVWSPGASPSHFINRAATKRTVTRAEPATTAKSAEAPPEKGEGGGDDPGAADGQQKAAKKKAAKKKAAKKSADSGN